jgi:hypothetical protein
MKQLVGDQLSLIAEDSYGDRFTDGDRSDVGDWGIDTRPLREKSIAEIREYFVKSVGCSGGQPSKPGSDDGGQNKNQLLDTCPPPPPTNEMEVLTCPPHRSAHKNPSIDAGPPSIFDRNEGDPGTWIETEHRKGGSYRKLRWREPGGKKPTKYLGKVA